MLVQYNGAAACLTRSKPVRAFVLKGAPLLLRIPPQHKALSQQLYRVGLGRIQVIHECYRVPLPRPVEFVLLWCLQQGAQTHVSSECSIQYESLGVQMLT